MNRKDINKIIRAFLPLTSEVIGAPGKAADMSDYLQINPGAGNIDFYDYYEYSPGSAALLDFFQSHPVVLKHSDFIARLNSARVWGRNGAVIGAGDYFIGDVSREFNKGMKIDHSIYYTIKQVKSKYLDGNVAVVGTAGANIYYHWMLDILPRLALIAKIISLEAVDYFITEFTQLPFQTETLAKVGIPLDKIIPSNENWDFHIKASTLLVPSLVGPLDQPVPFQVNFLRDLFRDCMSSQPPFRRIYISRKKVGRREIVNEAELLSCLAIHNFQIVYCIETSFMVQASAVGQETQQRCAGIAGRN